MEPHTREARTKGIPVLGAGVIYPVPESTWVIEPFQIPEFWPRAYGLDVGWNRTAAIWGAWDRQTDCVYVYSEHYLGQSPPSVHADAIKARGWWIPGAIDPASAGSSQVDGRQLRAVYNELGLNLHDADNSVEAGIHACYQRLSSGRLKVFSTARNLITEMRIYRRDENGKVVKESDHCLAPDTMVHTDAGLRRIADMVGTTGRVLTVGGQLAPYLNCRKTRENAEVVKVTFDDGSDVVCTDDHLFLTVDGWVPAGQLLGKQCDNAGTPRLGHAADDAPRQSLCVSVVPAGRSDVYCMEVPDHHAFAVEGGVIVHNCCDAMRYLVMTGMRFATTSPDFEEEPERRLRRNSVTGY